MKKKVLKERFLNKLELFYRNFGNEWSIDDFVKNENQKEYLLTYLVFLSEKGVISLNDDCKSFKILELPSKYEDLI